MSNIVILLTTEKQGELASYYASSRVERNAPGVIFAAKLSDTSITSYKSGKVMFQGNGAERESSRWGKPNDPTTKKTSSKGDKLPSNFEQLSVMGSDETGTGDYFGPVTVAAVYVSSDKIELVRELGVKDSKMLTDDFMRQIAPDLMRALPHSILTVRNDKYNTIQARGWSQGKIKAMMHNQALHNVLGKIAPKKPAHILIDQFAERGIYYNHLKNEKTIVKENVLFATKAEQLHVSVAAASILARYAFLKEMDRLGDLVGFDLQKGASNKVDEMAARILLSKGEETLKSMTKWHFANTQKAHAIATKKRSK